MTGINGYHAARPNSTIPLFWECAAIEKELQDQFNQQNTLKGRLPDAREENRDQRKKRGTPNDVQEVC
jgi:hypothetical protein